MTSEWTDVDLVASVERSLIEDIGDGDITAALLDPNQWASAVLITRQPAVVCGTPWVNETFRQVDDRVALDWHVKEGEYVEADTVLLALEGPATALLTGERVALNWLQMLSGVATVVHQSASHLSGYHTRLLDTRKTIPGHRAAQKYAVRVGGGTNHRQGLYDAYLIKENHILSCGSIEAAVAQARQQRPDCLLEVEVESLDELSQALAAGVPRIMLDNFSREDMVRAVEQTAGRAELEVSGNVSREQLVAIAQTGVDFISMGALTKHIHAIDLSMRITMVNSVKGAFYPPAMS